MKKLISIVVPVYNEESNLDELARRLAAVFDKLPQYDFEAVLVENGSSDGSWAKIKAIRANDARFKSIQLSRNFIAEGGISAGLNYAGGDAAVVMCADLQDPPEMIPTFIQKWEEGYDVAYHVVSERKGVGFLRRMCSEVFHWMMTKLTRNAFPRNGSVFRLMDRVAYQAFNQLDETNRYFPGLCNWIGFKSIGVEFARAERFAGESKARLSVVLKLALNGIFAFSYAPLRLVTFFGFFIASGSFTFLAYVIYHFFLHGRTTVPGIALQIAVTVLLFGFLFVSVGIIGEYLARVYDEVKRRPIFIVKEKLGLNDRA